LQNQEGPGYKLQFFFLSTFDDFKWTMQWSMVATDMGSEESTLLENHPLLILWYYSSNINSQVIMTKQTHTHTKLTNLVYIDRFFLLKTMNFTAILVVQYFWFHSQVCSIFVTLTLFWYVTVQLVKTLLWEEVHCMCWTLAPNKQIFLRWW
jgi:hypothetical protein